MNTEKQSHDLIDLNFNINNTEYSHTPCTLLQATGSADFGKNVTKSTGLGPTVDGIDRKIAKSCRTSRSTHHSPTKQV